MLPHPVQIINWLTFYIKSLFEVHWINSWQYSRPLYNMSFNDMIYTKLLNTYRINSIHSEKLLAIWIHIQKLQLFDKTFVAFFILYKFHGTLIEMNLNTHIFSQKIKLRLSSLYRNLPINFVDVLLSNHLKKIILNIIKFMVMMTNVEFKCFWKI